MLTHLLKLSIKNNKLRLKIETETDVVFLIREFSDFWSVETLIEKS